MQPWLHQQNRKVASEMDKVRFGYIFFLCYSNKLQANVCLETDSQQAAAEAEVFQTVVRSAGEVHV